MCAKSHKTWCPLRTRPLIEVCQRKFKRILEGNYRDDRKNIGLDLDYDLRRRMQQRKDANGFDRLPPGEPGVRLRAAASRTDPRLINPWGIAFIPGQTFWIADNKIGASEVLDATGALELPSRIVIPSPLLDIPSAPTGPRGSSAFYPRRDDIASYKFMAA